MIGRLQISILDNQILFHGTMTTLEAFDFINYFDKQGFTEIEPAFDDACLILRKPIKNDLKNSICSSLYDLSEVCDERDCLRKRVKELEDLIKNHIEQSLPESEIIYGV